jgi:hypothetical protein
MSTPDAATLAAGIDTTAVAGHNLRALLLRLADGDRWRDDEAETRPVTLPWNRAAELGLSYMGVLTTLGSDVVDRLRPVPWTVGETDIADPSQSVAPNLVPCLVTPAGDESGVFADDAPSLVQRIAALLTADDLRAAKAYRTADS